MLLKFSRAKKTSDLELVLESGLVLEDWYFQEYQDLDPAQISAAEHYLSVGWKEGRNPNPYFDTEWYQKNIQEKNRSGLCPLLDYVWRVKKPATSLGLCVDAYCKENPESKKDPLAHYLHNGLKQKRNSFPKALSEQQIKYEFEYTGLFDAEWYLNSHSDLKGSEIDPFEHYCLFGWKEGRRPNPYFDPVWYENNCPSGMDALPPLLHYVKEGWKLARSPSRDFDAAKYLEDHQDVRAAGVDPLTHYLNYGVHESRTLSQVHEVPGCREIAESGLFLEDWYENQYEDLRGEGLNLWEHFLTFGAQEGRNPNPYFDTSWYVETYGESIPDDECPLLFYARQGWKMGQNPSPKFDGTRYREEYLGGAYEVEPLKHFLAEGKQGGNKAYVVNALVASTGGRLKVNAAASLVEDGALRALLDQKPIELDPPSQVFDKTCLNIHWVMPDFAPGAGGHMTIFRTIRFLEFFGHKNTIWIFNPTMHSTAESAYDDILKHFQVIQGDVNLIDQNTDFGTGDIIMATDWGSVAYVNAASGFKRRFYFVQDHEPEFYPQGSLAIAAKMTYANDLDCICASPWLKGLMEERYGRWASEFWLAVDKNIYNAKGRKGLPEGKVKIAFYARHFTSRRAVELGFLALEALATKGLNFEVHCFGANLPFNEAPFECVDHGVLTPGELASLYRECDLGIVFSATNYSLIPQEMMACGLPLIELDVESTRAIFPEDVVTLVSPNPRQMAEQIAEAVSNPHAMFEQASRALEWVSSYTWEQAAKDVEQAILTRLDSLGFEGKTEVDTGKVQIKASVVIPTWNGGEVFKRVITALENQKTPWPYEVLVIDSGSKDDTVEFVKSRRGIRLHQIHNSEFQHGRTRNLGISLTEGEYVTVLTQDALPADEYWLYNMVAHLEHFPEAAGAFGKHLAWPEADPFTKRDLTNHFAAFLDHPICVSKETDPVKWESGDLGWRQFLHFYSDNNSCMRRSVWDKIPYPEVKFGEDQAWAWEIIKAGLSKVYACQSVVYHSHDFDEGDVEKRAFEEAEFFYQYFGYDMVQGPDVSRLIDQANEHDERWGVANGVDTSLIGKRKKANKQKISGFRRAFLSVRPDSQ
ncbi:glycosyltransferase [Microbulbifer sp. JSM ZJ756]|uniref:rhamnosyltransferase WsaF family glycosyltransferase n=1 Tax=Microbulbifer sp. JSM ZJ756 TaxID=3376191 RepID=UPI0037BBA65E